MSTGASPSPNGRTWIDNQVIGRIAEMGTNAMAVYVVLARHVNGAGECHPGLELIATMTGLSERQVKREIKTLDDAGLIVRERRSRGRGGGVYNAYLLTLHQATGGPMNGLQQATGGPLKALQGDTAGQYNGPPVSPEVLKRSTTSKKLRFSDEDASTAKWMFDQIRRLNPEHSEPNFPKWATEIRVIRERDGRSDAEIRSLFAWANGDSFWHKNILCPKTLRKHWDRLTIERKSRNGNGNGRPNQRNLVTRGTLFVES